ncbi:MAG TPA: porin family protein [Cyclobacteriaceae bacterium]|nr:porin family protein [Cyclobacteriaceae bacterium]
MLLVLLLAAKAGTHAQFFNNWARENNPNYDNRKYTFGFLIGIHTTAYQLKYSEDFVNDVLYDDMHAIMPPWTAGFSLGFIVNRRLNEFTDLRLLPKVAFYEHKLNYQFIDESVQSQLIETAMVEFPLVLKYKSMRRGNIRMYMVGGVKPSFEASGKASLESVTDEINIRRGNFSLEAGMGFDFYYPLFKFSPEIRYSRGVANILGERDNIYSRALERVNTHNVSIYFLFQ